MTLASAAWSKIQGSRNPNAEEASCKSPILPNPGEASKSVSIRTKRTVGGGVLGALVLDDRTRRHREAAALACLLQPRGIVCLLSAAYLHQFVSRAPSEVWLAALPGTAAPRAREPMIRLVRWGFPQAFAAGITPEGFPGTNAAITSPARTVVDLLRSSCLVGGEEVGFIAGRLFLARGGPITELRDLTTATNAPANVRRVVRFLELSEGSGS